MEDRKKTMKRRKEYKEPTFRVVQVDYSDPTSASPAGVVGVAVGIVANATPAT